MVYATIKLTVQPEKRIEIIQTFMGMIEQIRLEQGCLSCNCYVDLESETNILFKEEWSTREDLDSHLKSNHFGVLVGAMKLLIQDPVFLINSIASTVETEGKIHFENDITIDSSQPQCFE